MQLVLQYGDGDGCTFSCTCTHPIEYESAEKALVDFETILNDAISTTGHFGEFIFAGIEMGISTFKFDDYIILPEIWTIDEWFKHECKNLGG